ERAAEQATLAQELGQDVKEIELFLRYASALPPHDIGQENAVIRQRMQLIEDSIVNGSSASKGPGHYALGRGRLAMRDYEAAREHLEQAIAAGYTRPEVTYTLGLTLGGLYQNALDSALRIENKEAREAEKRRAEQSYLEPALRYLRESEGTKVESQTYIEG